LPFSLTALVLANLLALVGVLAWDWDAAIFVLLYWAENVVVGFYNVLKMALVRMESRAQHLGKLLAIPFFCLHFGGFCAIHGFILLGFFEEGGGARPVEPELTWPGPLAFLQLLVSLVAHLWRDPPAGLEWPLAGLVVSHGVSFIQNYLGRGEYRRLTVGRLMNQPYRRIILFQITIIGGGFLALVFGSPVPLLCVLVLLKILVDGYCHVREHRGQAPEG